MARPPLQRMDTGPTGLREQDKPAYVSDAGKDDFLYGDMAESP